MFDYIILGAMLLLSISVLLTLYRVIKGPSVHDRILALDSIGYTIIGIVALLSIYLDSHAYMETILLIGVLAFLGTVALSRYMERGVVIERKRND